MFKGKITSLANYRATVACEDGQTLFVPISDIEGAPKVGSDIVLIVAALGAEDSGRTKLAQALLNELLKG